MLTFSLTDGSTLRIAGGSMPLVVFPAKAKDKELSLMAAPEEEPQSGVISWPGEYDASGISVRGIGHNDGKQVSYVIELDGVRCALPSQPLSDWPDFEIEQLGDIQVLAIAATDAKKVQHLLDEADPRVLILVPGEGGKIDADVLKAAGAIGKEPVKEFKLKGSLPAEGREVVVLAA